MKNFIIQTAFLFILLIVPVILFAQTGFDEEVVDAPIDGGVSLLIAAGIGYGIKKSLKGKSKEQNGFAEK